ncbi:MAG TPA: tetratricopeptide repeat protein [Candidatus Acidoferrales bacterium]|nr:tetratricopeptide repeat protein [Candidatus Acidoferrales bacterium]
MSFPIESKFQRAAVLIFSALTAAAISIVAIPIWRADSFAGERTESGWTRATQIEPGYGEYWYNLAVFHRTDFEHANPALAISELKRATADDPRSADYWAELGDTYEAEGDLPAARDAYQRALENYPDSGDVHWRYGNFLLRQGQAAEAYAQLRQALVSDPKVTELAISRIWRATGDAKALLETVLPNTDLALQLALKFFCDATEPDAAMLAWQRIVGAGRTQPLKISFPLIDLLASRGRSDDARTVWTQALQLSGTAATSSDASLIYNGGFEEEPSNGGLDWREDTIRGCEVALDSSIFHSGRRSLRINFDGTQNLDYRGVGQRIPVKPVTRYEFSGWLKTAAISTDSGVRFAIEPDSRTMPAITLENLTGDHDWTNEHIEFTTNADTHFLILVVRRFPSRKFENEISGAAWVDDVSLVPADAAAGSHP